MRLDNDYIDGLLRYLKTGELGEDFEHSSEERRYEILDFLEKLMELGEIADQTATSIIFKNSQLGQFFGPNTQK